MSDDDRRVRRTRSALHAALLGLLAERSYTEITVSEVIERADVGRSTFYAHYRDKDDLFADAIDVLRTDLMSVDAHPGPGRLSFSLPFLEHLDVNRAIARTTLSSSADSPMMRDIERMLLIQTRAELRTWAPNAPASLIGQAAAAAVGAFLALVEQWLAGASAAEPRAIDTLFQSLVVPGITATLAEAGAVSGSARPPAAAAP